MSLPTTKESKRVKFHTLLLSLVVFPSVFSLSPCKPDQYKSVLFTQDMTTFQKNDETCANVCQKFNFSTFVYGFQCLLGIAI